MYHTDQTHVGKHIKCSRCGSLFPVFERVATVVQRPANVARSGVSAQSKRRPTWHLPTWTVGGVATLAIIALALIWFRFGNKAPKSSGDFQVADSYPTRTNVVTRARPDFASSQESEPRPTLYRSLPTGARFCSGTQVRGEGMLTVENGTSEDAALRLYDASTEKTIRCLFVKAHDSARVTGIPEGTYGLKYSVGLDWQGSTKAFRWLPSYSRFESQFVYSEERVGNEIQYHEISVTLHSVVGGTLRAISISREEFLRGDQDASVER
jgi:hypothetical protein